MVDVIVTCDEFEKCFVQNILIHIITVRTTHHSTVLGRW